MSSLKLTVFRFLLAVAVVALIVLMGHFGFNLKAISGESSGILWSKISPQRKNMSQVTSLSDNSENAMKLKALTAGPGELAQLEYFLNDCHTTCQTKQNISKDVRCHRHKIKAGIRENGYPVITIQEFENNKCNTGEGMFSPSKGGSNFRIEVYGKKYRILCAPMDHLNGTYTAVCPKIYSCETGRVFWDYAHFEAFRHHSGGNKNPWPERIHKEIGSFHICTNDTLPSLRENTSYCKNKSIEQFLRGRWWEGGSGSKERRWGTEDGCLLPIMTKRELKKCFIDSKINVHFFGDSHIQNTHTFLRRELDAIRLPKSKWPPSLSKSAATYSKVTMKMVNLTLSDYSKMYTSNDILVVNFGIWDLVFKSAENLIKEFPPFIKFTERLKNNPKTSSVRMIYINVFPRTSGEHDANYYMIPALNEMFRPGLESLGVEVIDGFNILNPFMYNTCDGCHYVCVDKATGIGKIFSHLLFRKICKDVI